MIKAYWHQAANVGDTLTPYIVKFFTGQDVKLASRHSRGKLLGVGSIMTAIRARDVVWGTGCIRNRIVSAPANTKFLAVRGPLTRELIDGANVPEIYGDPGLLLPLMYRPEVEKTHDVGFAPHHIDQQSPEFLNDMYHVDRGRVKMIDVKKPWKEFVREVLSCKRIISSSLHGLVIAEAYGIPAEWKEYSDNVIGKGFKFRDYFLSTGRKNTGSGQLEPIANLASIQEGLVAALRNHYCNGDISQ